MKQRKIEIRDIREVIETIQSSLDKEEVTPSQALMFCMSTQMHMILTRMDRLIEILGGEQN